MVEIMKKSFTDKREWALILGGSSGLGLASAKKLASQGMNICIVHRDRKSDMPKFSQEVISLTDFGIEVMTFNADATRSEKRNVILDQISKIFHTKKGTIKTLIHSIARGNLKPMQHDQTAVLSNDDFKVTIDAMAISLYDWVREIFEAKLFSEDARVISFTSEGNVRAWKNYAAVSAAKVALEAISRSIALEYAPYGIKSNCIQAGVTDTKSFRMIPNHEEIREHTLKRNPYRRLTKPEDVANVVYLLCREEASWINGAIIPVDGGERIV
jgi:enoyl-[acyl-carrier protein] reductase I